MLDVMIKRSSLKRNSEVVYSQLVKELEESIRRGELAPGEQIPPENLLAEQFGISRSSVRVGLNLLENRGIVVKRAGKTRVRPTTQNVTRGERSRQRSLRPSGAQWM